MCFLCDEWILRADRWEAHCQDHLRIPEHLPVQCDPLMCYGILAAPGYCPICMGNKSLPAVRRMRQYPWMDHVSRCFDAKIVQHASSTDTDNALNCDHPHPRCAIPFESAQKLRFHYEDVHCASFAKGTKRPLSDAEREIDSEAELEADRPPKLRKPTLDKAQVKSAFVQPTRYVFVQPKSTTATTGPQQSKSATKSQISVGQ